jgi:hypothetical protein
MMKRVRFTEDQIIAVLREHEAGAKTGDLARKHGVSEATLYNCAQQAVSRRAKSALTVESTIFRTFDQATASVCTTCG